MASPLEEGTLMRLVLYQANRFVQSDEEAQRYLKDVYADIHLDWEEEED